MPRKKTTIRLASSGLSCDDHRIYYDFMLFWDGDPTPEIPDEATYEKIWHRCKRYFVECWLSDGWRLGTRPVPFWHLDMGMEVPETHEEQFQFLKDHRLLVEGEEEAHRQYRAKIQVREGQRKARIEGGQYGA